MNLRFGDYELRRKERQLMGPAGAVDLGARSFDILMALLSKPNEVVTKEQLLSAVWPGIVVEDNTLQVHMSALRKALPPEMIVTVHGRGYKYAGPEPQAAKTSEPPAKSRKPVIAVLPFENLSGDPGEQFFSDGIAADITDRLTRFPMLGVIGTTSAFAFRATEPDSPALREGLQADYVVTGSVRRGGDRVRIAARLTDAASGMALWAERYDRPLSAIFELQDELTSLIAAAISKQLEISIAGAGHAGQPTSFACFELILRGMWHFDRITKADTRKALEYFEQAQELAPGNGEIIGWRAICHSSMWLFAQRKEDIDEAIRLSRQGCEADPSSALPHTVLGMALVWTRGREAGRALLDKAIALNSSSWMAHGNRSLLATYDGMTSEARALMSRVRELNPAPPLWQQEFECISWFPDGRYADVLPGVEAIPEGQWDGVYALACHGLLGIEVKAKALLTRARRDGWDCDFAAIARAEPYADPAVNRTLVEGIAKSLAF